MANTKLTPERLRQLLNYDPQTGVFTHACRKKRVRLGSVAGTLEVKGYWKHRIDGETHRGHRLAWLYFYGEWPAGHIDHINGNRSDNRIANLRDVTALENRQNIRKANSATGFLGVYKLRDKFVALIGHQYKNIRLGAFDTAEEAHEAYLTAKRRLHAGNML